jgi:hypothetical protein
MLGSVPPEKRAEWREWSEKNVEGGEASVERATDAALQTLMGGGTVDDAMEAARAAAGTPSAAAAERGHPVSDHDHLRGVVSIFRERSELMGRHYGLVWTFRVDSWDESGVHQPPVTVEMRGHRFTGSIGEGDWVEIPGHWQPGEVVHIQSLRNIGMNCPVAAVGGHPGTARAALDAVANVVRAALFVAAVAFIGLIAWRLLTT